MKLISILFVFVFILDTSAQNKEEPFVKETILEFFEAFHRQDSVGMRALVSSDVVLQTIGKNREGIVKVRNENFEDLVASILSIPDSVAFKERLLSFSIQVDGAMANVWVPYEFWYQNKFHHCGVNSFQLFKEEEQWKIIYLIDTRRKEGCKQ